MKKENQNVGITNNNTQDDEIVSIILADRKAKEQSENPAVFKTTVITNDSFFTDTNDMGWMSKQEFIESILNGLSETELKEFNLFLKKLTLGERFSFKPLPWSKTGKSWYFVTFNYLKGEQKYKIPSVGQTETFLVLYQSGVIICDISLLGLRNVALS